MTTRDTNRAIGYIRVSTEKQADEGLGLAVQEQAIRTWAKREGVRLVAVARDEGLSGTLDAQDRPALTEALAAIADGQADALVVARLDRLARVLTVQEGVLAQVWKHGGRVFTTEGGEVLADDPEDPARTAMRQMMGVFAQLERGMIAARLRAGRRLKAERGGYAYGAPHYGARAEDRALVEDPAEVEAIAYAMRLRAEGASYRAIAEALTEAGHRPKRSDTWYPMSVARIVARAS